ncbi:MAG: hypothetical protein ACTH1R_12030 [Staphylococcus equorum]
MKKISEIERISIKQKPISVLEKGLSKCRNVISPENGFNFQVENAVNNNITIGTIIPKVLLNKLNRDCIKTMENSPIMITNTNKTYSFISLKDIENKSDLNQICVINKNQLKVIRV